MIRVRVSHLDTYREWLDDEEADIGWLVHQLTDAKPTEAMLRGTAFHKALEIAVHGEMSEIKSEGFLFLFEEDYEIPLPYIREVRGFKNYGGIEVTGQVDAVLGNLIYDHKSTQQFDAERYMRKYQWRFYLDIFKAQRFRWNIFEMREIEDRVYRIGALHTLEQTMYPELGEDCRKLALDFKQFAEQHHIHALAPAA